MKIIITILLLVLNITFVSAQSKADLKNYENSNEPMTTGGVAELCARGVNRELILDIIEVSEPDYCFSVDCVVKYQRVISVDMWRAMLEKTIAKQEEEEEDE